DDGSVPIVSQTEIEPIKTALSLMFALVTTTALTESLPVPKPPGPGGSCPHGYIASGCTPSPGASDAIAEPSNGTCPWGWVASGSYCLRDGRARLWPWRQLWFSLPGRRSSRCKTRRSNSRRIVEARRQYQLRVPFSQGHCLLLHWNVTTALPSIHKSASVGREH